MCLFLAKDNENPQYCLIFEPKLTDERNEIYIIGTGP